MLKNSRRSINNKYLKKQIILISVIVIYMLSLSFIAARYVLKRVNNYLASSKEFYFYSDKLKENEENKYIITWSGTETLSIPINVYTKMNSLKKAEYSIAYEINIEDVPEGIECVSKGAKSEGVIGTDDNEDSFTLEINSNRTMNIGDTFEVKVSVTTTDVIEEGKTIESYTKTLSRTFKIQIVDSSDIKCKIEDKQGRAYLNFIANNETTLIIDDKELIFDNTNKNTSNWLDEDGDGDIDKITVSKGATIKIFKKNKGNFYTNVDIEEVEENTFKIGTKDVNQ